MRHGALIFALAGLRIASAQAPDQPLRFDVASIRPVEDMRAADRENPSFGDYQAGRATSFCLVCISGRHYDYYGAKTKILIAEAHGIDSRLVVGPDWLNNEPHEYVIRALMPEGAGGPQVPEMLKSLLAERFHLSVYKRTAEQTGYNLVVGKKGPKLKPPAELDRSVCSPWVEPQIGMDGRKILMCRTTVDEGDTTWNVTAWTDSAFGPSIRRSSVATHEWQDEFFSISTEKLAENLSNDLSTGSPIGAGPGTIIKVVDRTALDGEWRVGLDRLLGDHAFSTISSSLERKGLQLEKTTTTVETLVVDQVDKEPTEN